MGSKQTDNHEERLGTRVTRALKQRIRREMRISGVTMSDIVRELLERGISLRVAKRAAQRAARRKGSR